MKGGENGISRSRWPEWIGTSDRFPPDGALCACSKPWEMAERLSQEIGVKVIAARDGMILEIDEVLGC